MCARVSRGVLWRREIFLAGGEGGVFRGGREWREALPCSAVVGAVGVYDLPRELIVTTYILDLEEDGIYGVDILAFDVAAFGWIILNCSKYWDGYRA